MDETPRFFEEIDEVSAESLSEKEKAMFHKESRFMFKNKVKYSVVTCYLHSRVLITDLEAWSNLTISLHLLLLVTYKGKKCLYPFSFLQISCLLLPLQCINSTWEKHSGHNWAFGVHTQDGSSLWLGETSRRWSIFVEYIRKVGGCPVWWIFPYCDSHS